MEFRTVFQGSYSKALALRSLLAQEGYETFIRDENIKNIDPFITGGQVFDVSLQAPEEVVPEILEFLSQREPAAEAVPEPNAVRKDEPLEALGRRVRWAAVTVAFAPVAVYLGMRYLTRSSGLQPKPRNHFWTVFAFWFSAAELIGLATLLGFLGFAA